MNKLIASIDSARAPKDFTVEDWNEAVRLFFGPYFRRKSLLKSQREMLRTELINLAKILPHRENTELLKLLLSTYRSAIRVDRNGSYKFMSLLFPDTVTADEKWMSLFISHTQLPAEASLTDRVYQNFDLLDAVLEGSYKLHLRLLYGFSRKHAGSPFPSNVRRLDFGEMAANFPPTSSSRFQLLLEDPEHHIKVNQWRNIAAHKSFVMKSSRTFELEYGKTNPRMKRTTLASLVRTVRWAVLSLNTLRLATVIIYIEHMKELKVAGLQDVPLRLESWITGLCHNLGTVGFRCESYGEHQRQFTLVLRDVLGRPIKDAIVHASQVLDQLSLGLDSALSHRVRVKRACVALVDGEGRVQATASVDIKVALASLNRKIKLKRYVSQIDFTTI